MILCILRAYFLVWKLHWPPIECGNSRYFYSLNVLGIQKSWTNTKTVWHDCYVYKMHNATEHFFKIYLNWRGICSFIAQTLINYQKEVPYFDLAAPSEIAIKLVLTLFTHRYFKTFFFNLNFSGANAGRVAPFVSVTHRQNIFSSVTHRQNIYLLYKWCIYWLLVTHGWNICVTDRLVTVL